jgi:hypothetical protein
MLGLTGVRGIVASAVLAGVLAGGVVANGATPTAQCSVGRYLVDGGDLFEGGVQPKHLTGDTGHGGTVSLVGDRVSIEGVCPETQARLKAGRTRTKVTAKWTNCAGFGLVRLVGALRGEGCDALQGRIIARKPRFKRRFQASRMLGDPTDCVAEDTFMQLQRRVFGGCRVSTCHGSTVSGGLDLRVGAAHFNLVDQPATNSAAAAAGKKRVVPGDPDASFLWQKLVGHLEPDEGERMPSTGREPTELELEMLRAWIAEGAPQVGVVESAPCLPPREFVPAEPLLPPPGGYQIVFEGPTLAPGEEGEGCMWIEAPFAEDFVVGTFEYSLNPGTHHFAMWEHARGPDPVLNVFDPDDLACLSQGARPDGVTISGAGETPYFVDDYPAGAGRRLTGGMYIGINPHYYNEFDSPIQEKIWINLHPVVGPLEHEVQTLLSTPARLGSENSYSFEVPAFSTATHRLRYTNTSGVPLQIFELSSHQHQRGTRFTAWNSSGTRIFENFDWAHPAILDFDTPLALAPNDWIEFECEWDNGLTRPVRRCGDSVNDTGCMPGEPVDIGFGVTAQDEMCFLTGFYWTD